MSVSIVRILVGANTSCSPTYQSRSVSTLNSDDPASIVDFSLLVPVLAMPYMLTSPVMTRFLLPASIALVKAKY